MLNGGAAAGAAAAGAAAVAAASAVVAGAAAGAAGRFRTQKLKKTHLFYFGLLFWISSFVKILTSKNIKISHHSECKQKL
jgi:ABC-type uncharacterized transport system permease subunit